MTIDTVADVLAGTCLISGALLSLAAGVGLLRFPDLLSRMHAATKPQVLGLLLILAGAALRLQNTIDITTLVLVGDVPARHRTGRRAHGRQSRIPRRPGAPRTCWSSTNWAATARTLRERPARTEAPLQAPRAWHARLRADALWSPAADRCRASP